jgi:cytochrome c5
VPANVKTVVDTLCAGCHISGVANAPKYGDKAAWDERLSMGMDKLLASAIAGKGAMPARGGSQLSDAELRIAIEYMATK